MAAIDDDLFAAARARIAAQQGRLKGWRPLPIGRDVAVMAVEVLGHVRDEPGQLGLRVAVAGRTPDVIDREGERAAEAALRKRAVLGPSDPFVVEGRSRLRDGEATPQGDGKSRPPSDNESRTPSDDPLTWPWRTMIFHVPLARLPAIAGLATDAVRGEG